MNKLGATTIAEAVVCSVFPIPRHVCVSNVSWSLLPYEADLIAVTGGGYMIEVEIKVSLADLRRDGAKRKWKMHAFENLVSRFYYAMPSALWAKPEAQQCVPDFAGVIVVSGEGIASMEREATRNSNARALTNKQQFDLARVGSYRAWSPAIKHRLRQLKARHELEKAKRERQWQDWLCQKQTKLKPPNAQRT